MEADTDVTEPEESEDEELMFDPDKDLWVSVRVERSGRNSGGSYWVWEVGRRPVRITDSPLNTYSRWEKLRKGAISQEGEECCAG